VVEELGLDAVLPGRALVDERLAQPHLGAQLADVLGRDPGLRQAPLEPQVAQVAGVEAVGLGAPLPPAQAARLGRLGQVGRDAGRLQLLDDEAPAGGGLKRRLHRLAIEPAQEAPEAVPIGRANPPRPDLAGVGVERVEGDLLAVHVEPNYDRHRGLLKLHGLNACADHHRA
jgi:hypothetical protein